MTEASIEQPEVIPSQTDIRRFWTSLDPTSKNTVPGFGMRPSRNRLCRFGHGENVTRH